MAVPKLSVVMATYGHGGVLERSLRAILTQSRPADEVIVVDDASTDATPDILRALSTQHPSLQVCRNEQNLGAIRSLERAFSLATGDLLYGAASDDFALPGAFAAACVQAEAHPQAGLVFGEMLIVDPLGRPAGTARVERWTQARYYSPEEVRRDWIEREPATHALSPSTFFSRRALEEAGGFRWDLKVWSDTFAARTLALRHGACYLPQPLAAWTLDDSSLSQGWRSDPRPLLDLAARIAAAMREPAHRDLYPEAFVERWERDFREAAISGFCQQVEEATRQLSMSREILADGGALGRASALLVRGATGALNLAIVTALRRALRGYPGGRGGR